MQLLVVNTDDTVVNPSVCTAPISGQSITFECGKRVRETDVMDCQPRPRSYHTAQYTVSIKMAAQAKDLLEYIDFSAVECLNQKATAPATNALKQGYRDQDEVILESDADEQLLLNIGFNQKVKIQSIAFKGPAEEGPRHVKLYANRGHLGFSDVQGDTPASQEMELTEQQIANAEPIALKMAKFAFVTSLSIFIETNQAGSETTKISKIALQGASGEVFNVAKIEKVKE